MRIVRKLAYLSPLPLSVLILAGCTGYNNNTRPYGSTSSGGQVISAPRTSSPGSVYSSSGTGPGSTSSWGSTTTTTDSSLISEIRQGIAADQALRTTASQVQVSAQNGAVTLTGSVPDQQTRDSVIALVRRTPGVTRVVDSMYLTTASSGSGSQYQTQPQGAPIYNSTGSSSTTETVANTGSASGAGGQIFSMQVDSLTETDRNLAQQILQGLRTDNSLSTLLPRVNINVAGGRVILQGQVQNQDQRQTIEDVVRRAAGTSNVENQLQVRQ